MASVETAKQNGSWTILDDAEKLLIPQDLEQEMQKIPNAGHYFLTLSKTDKRNILQWLIMAKRPETRQKRISEIVASAAQNLKPKSIQWTKKPAND